MTSAWILPRADLGDLVDRWLAAGTAVVAPAAVPGSPRGAVDYRPIRGLAEARLDAGVPARSLKGWFLPATEPLFGWRHDGAEVTLEDAPAAYPATVILGARPCDAAALEIVDKVMGWDYRDEPWFGRRQAATIVAVACPGPDESCFCGAVGQSPTGSRGADALLTPVDGGFRVEVLTAKGEALLAGPRSAATADSPPPAPPSPRAGLDAARLRPWLEQHFEDGLWSEEARRCHGCGACASVCPTCHCFDIVNEPEGSRGTRRRNWDFCQTALFTLHASGHNPRRDQAARLRQRVTHKFAVYPKRFGEILCTGCGRCVRACPAGVNLLGILDRIAAQAGVAP